MTDELPPGTWRWLNTFARWLAGWGFWPVLRVRTHGRERLPRTGPVVIVVNHSSLLDGPVMFGLVRRRAVFLIKQEMFRGVLGVVLRRLGQLAIRRDVPHREPLLAAVRVLRSGGLVGVFPEGHRGAGNVSTAANGAAWLARSGGATVLPIACRGTWRDEGEPRLRRPVDVLVGEPIALSDRKGRTGLAEATEQIRVALAALVNDVDRLRDGRTGADRDRQTLENTGE